MALKMRKNQSVSKMIYVTDNITDDITMLYQKVIKQEYCHCALSHHTTGMRTKTDDGCHQQIVMFTLCWQYLQPWSLSTIMLLWHSFLLLLLLIPSVRTCCPTQSWTGVCIDGWTYFSTLKTTHLPRGCLRRPESGNTIRYSSASFNTRWSHYRSFWMIVTNDMLRNQISDANLHCVPY